MPDVLHDLLEIASYVYAADAAISRGGPMEAGMGKRWRRRLRFVLPVCLPELWSSPEVSAILVETLSFLSEDIYAFEFEARRDQPRLASYLDLPSGEGTTFAADEVVLFSGGLDSLAGAVEELAVHGRKVVLVSHRSASKIVGAQRHLVEQLRSRFGPARVFHVPIWANVSHELGKEFTHRTRSFLFGALAAVTARLLDVDRIKFYENGVLSLNLPFVDQVVGARATRSTHPQALAGFAKLLSTVLDRPFEVLNPFAWKTKTDVVHSIAENGCSHLIRDTRSCTRVHDMIKYQPHCGHCSQCIDRRFAVLAAGQEHEDPAEAYQVDLFTGARPPGPNREMALSYVHAASEIARLEDIAFFARFGEASRVVGFFDEPTSTVAARILDLHRRHASAVCGAFDDGITAHRAALREGTLPSDCLLALVVGRHGVVDRPEPATAPEPRPSADPEIRIAIDEEKGRVRFERWGVVTGKGAELIIFLSASFRLAVRQERAPEHYPFIPTGCVADATGCQHDEALRKRLNRLRKRIARMAEQSGDLAPDLGAVIENHPWKGYRLNPDRVRIVAAIDLQRCPGN